MTKRILSALLILLIAAIPLTSCGETAPAASSAVTAAAAGETSAESAAETAPAYDWPSVDYEGYGFRAANPESMWDMYVHLDTTEMTGDVLDDEVYKRNRKVEELLNFSLEEIELADSTAVMNNVKAAVLAGSDDYDIAYLQASASQSLATANYFVDLYTVDGLNLDKPWWDSQILESLSVAGKSFYGPSDLHLMIYDASWAVFFNESMCNDLALDMPYDLVRQGTWTVDRFMEYQSAAVSLNGDDTFKWNPDNSCVYGLSADRSVPFVYGVGAKFIDLDKDGMPQYVAENEEFVNRVTALGAVFDTASGMALAASSTDLDAAAGGYVYTFAVERAMFLTIGMKGALEMREYDVSFGFVPFPKYNEQQDDYLTTLSTGCMFLVIPVTNPDTARTGVITDALSYESSISVKPVYYDVTVSQKGLRNVNSIEMLDYIFANRGVDLGLVYGWCTSLSDTLRSQLNSGSVAIASNAEKTRSATEKAIETYMTALEESAG